MVAGALIRDDRGEEGTVDIGHIAWVRIAAKIFECYAAFPCSKEKESKTEGQAVALIEVPFRISGNISRRPTPYTPHPPRFGKKSG